MNDRILSLLGICKRAGKLITGADTTIDSIRKSKAKLVIFANDFSKSSKKSVQTAADECNVKTMDEMISLINRLENDPELYRTLQQKQRQVLHTYFFDAPLQSLINCLKEKRGLSKPRTYSRWNRLFDNLYFLKLR